MTFKFGSGARCPTRRPTVIKKRPTQMAAFVQTAAAGSLAAAVHASGGRGAGEPRSGDAAKARENWAAKDIDGVPAGGGEGTIATGGG